MKKPIQQFSDSGNSVVRERENATFKNIFDIEMEKYNKFSKKKKKNKVTEETSTEETSTEETSTEENSTEENSTEESK